MLVGLAEVDQLQELRRSVIDFPNVLITSIAQDSPIPCADGFFAAVYAPSIDEAPAEILRAFCPDGTAWLRQGPVSKQ